VGHDHVLMPAMKVRVVDADLEALIGHQLIVGESVLVHDVDLHGQQFIGKKSEGFSVQLGRIAHCEMEVVVGGSVGIVDKDPHLSILACAAMVDPPPYEFCNRLPGERARAAAGTTVRRRCPPERARRIQFLTDAPIPRRLQL
jgi:hypothetical protein